MRCLIIGKVWPEPSSTAAGRRTCDLIDALQAANWQVDFASAAAAGGYTSDLNAIGVTTHEIKVNEAAFDSWVAALKPDVVVFDRFMTEEQFGWRVEKACPEALRVLDTSDLHCLREARLVQMKLGGPLQLQNEIALREIASIWRSDLTLMISDYEMRVLTETFQIDPALLGYWPFFLDTPKADELVGYPDRQQFMMIGSFLHGPNLDAARWCRSEIWPMIRQALPEAELHCYGSYGDKYAGELDAPKLGFHYKGRADAVGPTMQKYRVNLAPLRYGAGLKGKLFDAFAAQLPSVTTPIGAEGIQGDFEWGCPVSQDPVVFAQTAVEVYQSVSLWSRVNASAEQIVQTRFLREHWRPRLPELFSEAQQHLMERREANFTGKVLRHHHHRSTEFMSRWIEAKNQKDACQS